MDLATALTGNAGLGSKWSRWAENWNRIIPSWREVTPDAPAIVTIAMILLISILAFAALVSCVAELTSRRSKGLDDTSAPA